MLYTSVGTTCPIISVDTLKCRVLEEYEVYRVLLKQELANTCSSIALSFDAWTSPQGISILGVIGHWLTSEFEEREALLEFAEINGKHSGENVALVVEELLFELDIADKMIALTGDNAGNNGTCCDHLHKSLLQTYDNADVPP
jgi:hypothetical protein